MKVFKTDELIEELVEITQANYDFIKKKCFHLSQEQLDWRPNASTWSTTEVLAHLNEYAKFYHASFKDRLEKTKFKGYREQFISSPLGRSAWKSMKLGRANNIKRKFKSPRNYNPIFHKELIKGYEVNTFLLGQQELIENIRNAREVNLRKVKSPISISRIIRLRLGDAMLFVIYHNERHIQQIKHLLAHPKFPKKK